MAKVGGALFQRLTEAARMGADTYSHEYAMSLTDILSVSMDGEGHVAEVTAVGVDDISTAIKVSLLYNDTSIVDIRRPDGQQSISLLTHDILKDFLTDGKIDITYPSSQSDLIEYAMEKNLVHFGFMISLGDDIDQLMNDIAPLVNAGRLLPRPRRMLIVGTDDYGPEGGRHWHGLPAAPGSQLDSWKIQNEDDNLGKPTATALALEETEFKTVDHQQITRDIVLPYLQGVSLSDYSRILDDEGDLLIEFRTAMKDFACQVQSSNISADEFRKDVVEPRIAKIDRAFKRVENMYRIKAGGAAVATATLALVSFATGGVAAAITAAAGTAGFMASARELADRKDKMSQLKDDPAHLLWKLKRAQR